ncbi:hypothetical protein [Halovenus halobia]
MNTEVSQMTAIPLTRPATKNSAGSGFLPGWQVIATLAHPVGLIPA